MLAKRIIPCLDVQNGKVVKGKEFRELRYAGDAIELAKRYVDEGADELVFLDISATLENRETLYSFVREVAKVINIPFSVGGGVRSLEDAKLLLYSGADKVCINSAAILSPRLISEIAESLGSQSLVVAIDTALNAGAWRVFSHSGSKESNLMPINWALEAQERGAGEIILTSISSDGTKLGFANSLLKELSSVLTIPLIASGGAGKMEDFREVFLESKVDGALAASVFHYQDFSISQLKSYLLREGVAVRL